MKKRLSLWVTLLMVSSAVIAANSATIVSGSLVQGDVVASMKKGESAYQGGYGEETVKLNDWSLHTGEFSWSPGTFGAISTTNSNLNAYSDAWGSYGMVTDTAIGFGNGGSVTLKLDTAIAGIQGQKEFGLFTAQMLDAYGSVGSFWNGNMEAAILVSQNGADWVTLEGVSVAQDYTGSSHQLNAPTVSYNYETMSRAWNYGTGATAAQLNALSAADYTIPMIDDNLFNGSGTNADRALMASDSTFTGYDAVFGDSGGGNWFDISYSGLGSVNYIQLNAVNCSAGMGIRLDGVFTTDAAVIPEPATMLLLGLGAIVLRAKKK